MSEKACPFCGRALSADFRASPAPRAPAARLSRAALFAAGTGVAVLGSVAAVDCTTHETAVAPPYGAIALPIVPIDPAQRSVADTASGAWDGGATRDGESETRAKLPQ